MERNEALASWRGFAGSAAPPRPYLQVADDLIEQLDLQPLTGSNFIYGGDCPLCGGKKCFYVWADRGLFMCAIPVEFTANNLISSDGCGKRGTMAELFKKLANIRPQVLDASSGGNNYKE